MTPQTMPAPHMQLLRDTCLSTVDPTIVALSQNLWPTPYQLVATSTMAVDVAVDPAQDMVVLRTPRDLLPQPPSHAASPYQLTWTLITIMGTVVSSTRGATMPRTLHSPPLQPLSRTAIAYVIASVP